MDYNRKKRWLLVAMVMLISSLLANIGLVLGLIQCHREQAMDLKPITVVLISPPTKPALPVKHNPVRRFYIHHRGHCHHYHH